MRCHKRARKLILHTTRAGKGSEVKKIFGKTQKIPSQFQKFLANGWSNENLFNSFSISGKIFLTKAVIKLMISHGIDCHQLTWDAHGKCHFEDVEELISKKQEADTRLLLHAKHASDTGNHSLMVTRIPDTDVCINCLRFSEIIPNLFFQT